MSGKKRILPPPYTTPDVPPMDPSGPTAGKSLKIPHRRTRLSAEDIRALIPDFRSTGATLPQARFAAEYITNSFQGAQAYLDAVCPTATRKRASLQGARWLREPAVQTCIRMFTDCWLAEKRDSLEHDIIETLFAQAFYDPAQFITPEGAPAFDDWDTIPVGMRRCIEGIETKYYGKDADVKSTVLKLVNRSTALDRLAQYIALMKGTGLPAATSQALTPETEALLQGIFSKASFNRQGPVEVVG